MDPPVGWGSSTWRAGGRKVRYVPRSQGNQTFWPDIPGFYQDIPKVSEKFEKRKSVFNFHSLSAVPLLFFGGGGEITKITKITPPFSKYTPKRKLWKLRRKLRRNEHYENYAAFSRGWNYENYKNYAAIFDNYAESKITKTGNSNPGLVAIFATTHLTTCILNCYLPWTSERN